MAILMALSVALWVHADTAYESLTFVTEDGTEISYSVEGLKITFSDNLVQISNATLSDSLALSELSYMCFGSVGQTDITGDVNGDGQVSIADINAIIEMMLNDTDVTIDELERADVSGDGVISIADINAVIDIILAD